ncbi:MAG TPA: LacI family DNA-binding transcriptional regulator [Candidatus Synoicihabitans sp.]|nr:LacI family DNA-binding transcriptional regulator [Candidatus Synoicihabitans sp.]
MHAHRSATIKDVARAAGVHFTTVSMALRDHPSLPETTRARIRQVAEKLGYRRNPVFSALAQFHVHGRQRTEAPALGFVVNRERETRSDFFRGPNVFLSGAREQARLLGYTLDVLQIGQGRHDSRSLERYLRQRHIDGVIIAGFEPGNDSVALRWDDYAVVKIDSMHMAPAAMIVSNDHRHDVRMAFRQLRMKGYRRIGLAISRPDEESTQHRYSAGYLIEQAAVPLDDRVPLLVFPAAATRNDAVSLLHGWVTREHVDAVLSHSPAIDQLLKLGGFRVPQQVACACLSLTDAEDDTRLAGIHPNYRRVGATAVSQLATQLKVGERGLPDFSPQTYVPSSWHDGRSAPARN